MLTVQIDSREQKNKNKHLLEYFDANGIKYFISKLYVGDYQNLKNGLLVIDRKKDVLELAQCVCGKKRDRFEEECKRAAENNIRLVVLTEENYTYYTLRKWKSPVYKSGVNKGKPLNPIWGITIAEATMDFTKKYGVEFIFCDRTESGKKIVEILSKNN